MTPKDSIAEYFRRIDAEDVDRVMGLFAEDAQYQRADQWYRGRAALDDFFRNQRKIRGAHTLQNLWQVEDTVIAVGRFDGTGAAGNPKSVEFADFWSFRDDGKVVLRRSFLALGNEEVRD